MNSHGFIRPIAIVLPAVVVLLALFVFCNIDPRVRLEREHGLRLPPSSTSIECRGDAWKGFLDRGASSAFVMDTNELVAFTAQLKIQPGGHSFIPSNWQYQLHSAWRKGMPASSYACDSPVGDWLHVEVWPVDDGRVGVCLYTDWN